MSDFLSAMFAEMGARRRRLRGALGDRGQGLAEFLVFGGLATGSLGLFLKPWMAGTAPWGFALPLVFLAGYLLIEARRQGEVRAGGASERMAARYDWQALLWSFGCALLGVAAFVIAYGAEPETDQAPQGWTPPESAVSVDISP